MTEASSVVNDAMAARTKGFCTASVQALKFIQTFVAEDMVNKVMASGYAAIKGCIRVVSLVS
ncbi:hypothetical protein WH43_04780 [Rheinheimera sp. KL1]|nr:hypothetical protein WH43_04780 [Rheinheimera sp. KL1]